MDFKNINTDLVNEIMKALGSINFGSVEIIIQDGSVTQISTRNIKKTNFSSKNKIKQDVQDNLIV